MVLRGTHVFTIEARLGPTVDVGPTPGGFRRVIPIVGGVVRDGLDGVVLPGGADWNTVRGDGVTELWARYELRLADGTADGTVVSVLNTALHPPGAEPPILTHPRFEVPDGGPVWLRSGAFVGVLEPPGGRAGTETGTEPRVVIEVHRLTAGG